MGKRNYVLCTNECRADRSSIRVLLIPLDLMTKRSMVVNHYRGQYTISRLTRNPINQVSKRLKRYRLSLCKAIISEQLKNKMISGHYLGEIFRQVINEMIFEGILFLGQVCPLSQNHDNLSKLGRTECL